MSISTFPKIITHSEHSRQSFERFKKGNPPEYLQHWSERIDTDYLLSFDPEIYLKEETDLNFILNSFMIFDQSLLNFFKTLTFFDCRVILTEPFYSPDMETRREHLITCYKYGGAPLLKEYYIQVEDSSILPDTYFFEYILKQHKLNISNTYYVTESRFRDNYILKDTGVTILERQAEANNYDVIEVSDKYFKFKNFESFTNIILLAEKMSLARLEKYNHE